MRPGWNPTRRNRNSGTKAHGHGQDNRMSIPESWHEYRRFYEKLSGYITVRRMVGEHELTFFVEPTRPDWFYPCTVDDICAVLAHCDQDAVSTFDTIVMRQPTRKQKLLSSVWGRAIFYFEIEEDAMGASAIIIESHDLSPIAWPKSLSPEQERELERLRGDGYGVRQTRRGHEVHVTADSMRNTVLYRTLLHEIGHHVDFDHNHGERWDGKTSLEREDYAHRYALEWGERLSKAGVLPFSPIINEESLLKDGLKREWFCLK